MGRGRALEPRIPRRKRSGTETGICEACDADDGDS